MKIMSKPVAAPGCSFCSHHLKCQPFLLSQTPLFFVRLNLQTGPFLEAGDGDGVGGRWQLWQGPLERAKTVPKEWEAGIPQSQPV